MYLLPRAHRVFLRTHTNLSSRRATPSPLPPPEIFNEPSRPRQYYARPHPPPDLPPLTRKWPAIFALGVGGFSLWGAFLFYTTNAEKLSSSVVCQILRTARSSPELAEVLGSAIRPEPAWWLNGSPWVQGGIHMLQGNVDISFRLVGTKGAGTLYFTSVRKAKGEPFSILRFKLIADDGRTVQVPEREAGVVERKL